MKIKILLSATIVLMCGGFVWSILCSVTSPDTVTDITQIPQGAYEQIILEFEGITDREICRIYEGDKIYWDEVDRQMCAD
ncbi:hypothetical protein OWT79_10705 [Bacteroides fragilis]|nr:hypothetical protein [Bacteroides fragilis]